MTSLVPHKDDNAKPPIGYKRERLAIKRYLQRYTGLKPAEATMLFERFEYALDMAIQLAAPTGSGLASESMRLGFKTFLDGPPEDEK